MRADVDNLTRKVEATSADDPVAAEGLAEVRAALAELAALRRLEQAVLAEGRHKPRRRGDAACTALWEAAEVRRLPPGADLPIPELVPSRARRHP